jgi:hypothetical protein
MPGIPAIPDMDLGCSTGRRPLTAPGGAGKTGEACTGCEGPDSAAKTIRMPGPSTASVPAKNNTETISKAARGGIIPLFIWTLLYDKAGFFNRFEIELI